MPLLIGGLLGFIGGYFAGGGNRPGDPAVAGEPAAAVRAPAPTALPAPTPTPAPVAAAPPAAAPPATPTSAPARAAAPATSEPRPLPAEELDRPHALHTLDRIAFRAVPADQPATLRYLIEDYVAHLENHVRQVLPDYEPVSGTLSS